MELPRITVSRIDADRLDALLSRTEVRGTEVATRLAAELERAEVVEPEDLPTDVIGMNCTARFEEESGGGPGQEHVLTLVYPHEADGSPGKISILAPVGSALLGLSVGQCIDWPGPGGRTLRLRVLEVRKGA